MAKYVWEYTASTTKTKSTKKFNDHSLETVAKNVVDSENLEDEPLIDVKDEEFETEIDSLDEFMAEDPTDEALDELDALNEEKAEEVSCFVYEKDNEEDSIKYYLEEIARYKLLNADEEKQLSKRIQNGEQAALDHLIKSNLRLVVKIAKQYISTEYPLIDIIQDGNMGLIRACEKFDHRKNVRFSTYASWWIKQTIIRSLSIRKRMIRIPHRKEERYRKIMKAIDQHNQRYQTRPDTETISKLTDIPAKEVDDILLSMVNVVSYEQTFVEDSNSPILNVLSDHNKRPDESIYDDQLKREIEKILNTLDPKEKEILLRRFGFDSGEKYTLKSMGTIMGISAETIRQIEIKALRKLRVNFKYMRDYLN